MIHDLHIYSVKYREPVHKEFIWIVFKEHFLKRQVNYPFMDMRDVYQKEYYVLQHDIGYVAKDFVKGDFTHYLLDTEVEEGFMNLSPVGIEPTHTD